MILDKAICKKIEYYLYNYESEHEQIIELTYKEQYRVPKILRRLVLEKTAYYEKRNDIIMYAALKATEKGLVKH